MTFPKEMMNEDIWFDNPKYEEAEDHYQLFLNNNLSAKLSNIHYDNDHSSKVATGATCSALINEIAKARDNIKQSLAGMSAGDLPPHPSGNSDIASMQQENKTLKDLVAKLSEQVAALEIRVVKLEGGTVPKEGSKDENKVEEDADDDFDLFGDDDDEEEEETEEEKKIKEDRVRKYNEKKSGKKVVIAKSSVLFDVKPWEDTTDMKEMERLVRTIEQDGLVWGASKLVPLAYTIQKLQILCVIEDDKVSTDALAEKMCEFDNHVQSVDIAAFNKI